MITVVRAGPLTTVQDLGRPGFAHLGVPRSGALDAPALRRANALVGNPATAAGLETTLMGCALRFAGPARVAVTGAAAVVKVDKKPVDTMPVDVPAGALLDIGRATRGVRSYLAVAGGVAVEPVLGSRSADTLSGLGPPRLADGMTLPIGADTGRLTTGPAAVIPDELLLGVRLGPRDDWFDTAGLFGTAYLVSPVGNRVGCRLAGTALTGTQAGELPSEGVVLGAIQVPPDGQPLIFLADHPTTGGYPVIGVVDDVTPLARPGPGRRCGSVRSIDLNADLGEGFGRWSLGDDEALLDIVTSANVACGFHAGDPSTMHRICRAAVAKGVAVGDLAGYRDLAGFGRRRIDYDPDDLRDDILYQIGALDGFCRVAGDRVRYLKPHGALYNTAAVDEGQASAVVAAVMAYDPALPVLCQPGSVLARSAAAAGLAVVGEGFADHGYRTDGTLVPRSQPGALVHEPAEVVRRAVRMAVDGEVVAVDGSVIACPVRSVCLHGDTPGAVDLAREVRAAMTAARIPLRTFFPPA